VVHGRLPRRARVPLAGRQPLHARERLAPGALQLALFEQVRQIGIGVDDADLLRHTRSSTRRPGHTRMSENGRRRADPRPERAAFRAYREHAVIDGLPHSFQVHDAPLRGAPGVAVAGEVDVETVPRLELALDEAIRDSVGAFVIDLCDVEFLDSGGLNALLRARALLGREERSLAVVCPPGPVRRLFDVSGVADLLVLFATREEAAAALVPPE
jgi:anti-anti-sigma factor